MRITSLLLFFFLLLSNCYSYANRILIYSDEGADPSYAQMTRDYFTKQFELPVLFFKEPDLNSEFLNEARLVIFPGGADLPYMKRLVETGQIEHVLAYVAEGGSILGLCAGAYFLSAKLQFNDGVIVGDRVNLLPVKSIGPAFDAPYFPGKPPRVVTLTTSSGKRIKSLYSGGGFFALEDDKEGAINILARYEDGRIAVVSGKYGKGRVLLSHAHLEADPTHPTILSSLPDLVGEFIEGRDKAVSWFNETISPAVLYP